MTLSQQQQRFLPLLAKLIGFAYENGYTLTAGELYRTPEQAAFNAASGKGISNSLHTQRLAVDLNIFQAGVYLASGPGYKVLGDYWKTLDPDCAWGGDFHKPDEDHYSLSWGGVR